ATRIRRTSAGDSAWFGTSAVDSFGPASGVTFLMRDVHRWVTQARCWILYESVLSSSIDTTTKFITNEHRATARRESKMKTGASGVLGVTAAVQRRGFCRTGNLDAVCIALGRASNGKPGNELARFRRQHSRRGRSVRELRRPRGHTGWPDGKRHS